MLCEIVKGVVSENNQETLLFHIADVIVMFVHSIKHKVIGIPSFRLQTPSYCGLDLNQTSHEFLPTFSNNETKFLFDNADYLCLIFSCWGNHSILSIHLKVVDMLPNSSKLVEESRFVDHMEGKLLQLKREKG